MAKMEVLRLSPTQRGELHAYLRSRNLPSLSLAATASQIAPGINDDARRDFAGQLLTT